MKILVLTPYFYPHHGGSEHYIEGLYGELMRQNPHIKVDVLCYAAHGESKIQRYKGFTIYRVSGLELLKDQFALPNYFSLFALLKKLKKNHYTHVNAHTRFFDTAWWGWLVARYFGAEAILTDHCAMHPQHNSIAVRLFTHWLDHALMPFLYHKYAKITVVSQATKQFWHKIVGKSDKITVVSNGVDQELLSKGVKQAKSSRKISVRFFGRAIGAKGGVIFTQMINLLKDKYPQVVFERISGVSHTQALRLLSQTDIVVHPSMHHEGLPTVLLEAGLMGCAVVASPAGGTTDLIAHNQTGLLVEPQALKLAKAVEKLLQHPMQRQALGKHLQAKIVSRYTWDNIVRSLGRVLA